MRNFYRFGFRLSIEYMNICPIGGPNRHTHLHQQRKVKCAKTPTDLTSLSSYQTKTTATAENTRTSCFYWLAIQEVLHLPVRTIIVNIIFHFRCHCGNSFQWSFWAGPGIRALLDLPALIGCKGQLPPIWAQNWTKNPVVCCIDVSHM